MNDKPIGILDSGVGGITVWREIVKKLPNESTIYIADSKNCPYGKKSSKEIHKLARKLVQFLVKKDVKLIVVACNTITVSCLDKLRAEFPKIPIVGTVPVIKTAAERSKTGKIGVLSTLATAKSKYQKDLIEKFAKNLEVFNIGTDKLVPLIEKGKNTDSVLPKILEQFRGVDVLALGCTHFPLIKNKIQKILGSEVLILDSGAAIARQVQRVLIHNKLLSKSRQTKRLFYTTLGEKVYNIEAEKITL